MPKRVRPDTPSLLTRQHRLLPRSAAPRSFFTPTVRMTLRRRSFPNLMPALRSAFKKPKKAKTSRTTRRTRGNRARNNDQGQGNAEIQMPRGRQALTEPPDRMFFDLRI